jgi:hypothetical protein
LLLLLYLTEAAWHLVRARPWRTQQLRLFSAASCSRGAWLLGLRLLLLALTCLVTAAFLFIVILFIVLQAVKHI